MELIFGIFPFMFLFVFGLVIFVIVSSLVRNVKQNQFNNNSPRISSEVTVVTKRTKVWGDHSHTVYYATFQFLSGDRMELEVPANQFGYLVEGDRGTLTFQGTRYLNFERRLP